MKVPRIKKKCRIMRNPFVEVGMFRNSAGAMNRCKRLTRKRNRDNAKKMISRVLLDL